MLADSYHDVIFNPTNLDVLKATKGVRNFLCEYLYDDKLLLSYAPAGEFGSAQTYSWLMGGYVCDYDASGNTIAPRTKVNYRVIRSLFSAGLIQVKKDIRTPHTRCVIFEWIDDIAKYRREILRTKVFTETYAVTHQLINNTASLYGLKVNFIGARNVFELLTGDGKAIPNKFGKKTVSNTYIFMNEAGEPVTRLRDMSYWEWEEYLFKTATRAKTLSNPVHVDGGHFTAFKKN